MGRAGVDSEAAVFHQEAEALAEAEPQEGGKMDKDVNTLRSSNPMLFFSKGEKKVIRQAIAKAEQNTSGEIRLHIARSVKGDSMREAKKVFESLGMTATKNRNGVLIFFAIKNRSFVILADKGLSEKLSEGFWQDIINSMQQDFRRNDFASGMQKGIRQIGEVLEKHFPFDREAVGELPNEISFQ